MISLVSMQWKMQRSTAPTKPSFSTCCHARIFGNSWYVVKQYILSLKPLRFLLWEFVPHDHIFHVKWLDYTCQELDDDVWLGAIKCSHNFLHICTETQESKTCFTIAKNSSIMEKLLTSFGAQYGVKFLGKTKFDFWRNGRSLLSLKRARAKREL